MPKNQFFRHISGIFGRENTFFRKSGSVTFQTLAFCISVPNFMKKYKVQFEKFKKYRFSDENRLFRRVLESSGYKKLMMKSREMAKKPVFPAYFRHFRPEKNFSQKSDSAMFWALLIRVFVQKIRKSK